MWPRRFRCLVLGASLLLPALGWAQTSAPPSPAIEAYGGIFFFCKPAAGQDWSRAACVDIGAGMAESAARVKKPIVLLKPSDTRDKYPELARAKGFDAASAVWFLLTIDPHASHAGQWEIAARADGRTAPSPGGQPQTVSYSKRATAASPSAVSEMSKDLLGSLMFVLTTPMRPL